MLQISGPGWSGPTNGIPSAAYLVHWASCFTCSIPGLFKISPLVSGLSLFTLELNLIVFKEFVKDLFKLIDFLKISDIFLFKVLYIILFSKDQSLTAWSSAKSLSLHFQKHSLDMAVKCVLLLISLYSIRLYLFISESPFGDPMGLEDTLRPTGGPVRHVREWKQSQTTLQS